MSVSFLKPLACLRWLLLLVVICCSTPSCQGSQKLCGKALPETLDLVCKNGFGKKVKKSLDPVDYYGDIDDDIPMAFEQAPYMSLLPTNALTKTRRRRHGVFDECCRKPCSLSELQSYCL